MKMNKKKYRETEIKTDKGNKETRRKRKEKEGKEGKLLQTSTE